MRVNLSHLPRIVGGGVILLLAISMALPVDAAGDVPGWALLGIAPFSLAANLWAMLALVMSLAKGEILEWSGGDWSYFFERMNFLPVAFILILLGGIRLVLGGTLSTRYVIVTGIIFSTTLQKFFVPFYGQIVPSGLGSFLFNSASIVVLLLGGALAVARRRGITVTVH